MQPHWTDLRPKFLASEAGTFLRAAGAALGSRGEPLLASAEGGGAARDCCTSVCSTCCRLGASS